MVRVLLVDDDEHTLDVLDFSLTLEGFEITRATDGREGVDKARHERPDLIILDSMMPVMDGLTTTRVLRDDPDLRDTPIVMLTAKVMDADVWEGWQAGVDSYVTKPLDLTVLQRELARLGFGIDDKVGV